MKLNKKLISILLIITVILVIPNVVKAETYFEINIEIDKPVEGAIPDNTAVATCGANSVTVTPEWYESTDSEEWVAMTTEKFENGKYYAPKVNLTMEQIHDELVGNVNEAYSVVYKINGEQYMLETCDVYYALGIYEVNTEIYNLDFEGENRVVKGNDYSATLKKVPGYSLPDNIYVTISNVPQGENILFEYDKETGKIKIPANYIYGNIEIGAEGKIIKRFFISGENQNYVIGSETSLKFVLDDNYTFAEEALGAYVEKVTVDGEQVEIKNYVEDGKTVLELDSKYLNSLDLKTYKFEVEFCDDVKIETNFNIQKTGGPEVGEAEKMPNEISNPDTGDEIVYAISMLGFCLIGMMIASKIGKNK